MFYLGTHEAHWLWQVPVPLCVAHPRLAGRKRLHPALTEWVLDSGGFMKLKNLGTWDETPAGYVAAVRRYSDEIGRIAFAAPQDWMCEPAVINGGTFGGQRFTGTHLDVAEHQRRTVANYLQLRDIAPDLPFIPVLQGWTREDYLRCADLYDRAGVDLAAAPRVGWGSVCRRQGSAEAEQIARALAPLRLSLHGFGVKKTGLALFGHHRLASCDSLAWSYHARRAGRPLVNGCKHGTCANCRFYALRWRSELLEHLAIAEARGWQPDLFEEVA